MELTGELENDKISIMPDLQQQTPDKDVPRYGAYQLPAVLPPMQAFYSRPKTVSQLYPMFTLDKCTEIRGYYIDTQPGMTEYTIEKDSDEFQKLCALFWEQEYCRSLRDILPRGTRTYQTQPDDPNDYQWDVYFCFEDITLPDGSIGSGAMLHFQSWYGELDIYFDGESYSCYTGGQEVWAKEILEIIQ